MTELREPQAAEAATATVRGRLFYLTVGSRHLAFSPGLSRSQLLSCPLLYLGQLPHHLLVRLHLHLLRLRLLNNPLPFQLPSKFLLKIKTIKYLDSSHLCLCFRLLVTLPHLNFHLLTLEPTPVNHTIIIPFIVNDTAFLMKITLNCLPGVVLGLLSFHPGTDSCFISLARPSCYVHFS